MRIEIRIELEQDDIPDWVKALLQARSGESVTAPEQAQTVSPPGAAPEVVNSQPPPAPAEPVLEAPEPPVLVPAKRGRGRPRKTPAAAVAAAVEAKVGQLAVEPEPAPVEFKPPPEPEPKVTVLGLDLPASQVTQRTPPVMDAESGEEQPAPVDPLAHLSFGQRMLIDAGMIKSPTNLNGDRDANLIAQVAFEYDRVAGIYGAAAARQISGKALPEGVKFQGLDKLPGEFMPQVLSALRART